jgi:type IV pilus assembly protein PilM
MDIAYRFRKPSIGVDLGTRTIKGVRLRKKRNQVYLDRYFFHDLAKTSKQFPGQADSIEPLKANIEINQLAKARAAVNLRDEDVFNFNLQLPRMKAAEMRCAVAHEIQENINIPVDELSFDYVIAERTGLQDEHDDTLPGENVRVKAYCTKREVIKERIRTLKACGLKPCAAESDVLAILAMLRFNDYISPQGNVAVFDLGESHITSALISDNELAFSKSSPIGCGDINRALSDSLLLDYREGEKIKLEHDLDQDAVDDASPGKIVDEVYFRIFKEIKETLEYFKEHLNPECRIGRILLVGGGSRIRNIDKVFELFFKIPSTIVNPFRNIQIYETSTASQDERIGKLGAYMATAVGLALRDIA